MKYFSLQHLSAKEIEEIKKHLLPYTFAVRTDLFHEGQIPHAGVLVIDGSVKIKKRNRIMSEARIGDLIGLKELLENRPGKGTVEIGPQASICLIDRSTLNEVLRGPQRPLGKILYSKILLAS